MKQLSFQGMVKEPKVKLPALNTIKLSSAIALDTETTGLDVWSGDLPVGLSVYDHMQQKAWYLPWGHSAGTQYDPEHVRVWARDQLRGKTIVMFNARFDVHMLRAWSLDLEELGCRAVDAVHQAALLAQEGEKGFSLSALSKRYLGEDKLELPKDSLQIHEKSAQVVAPYAEKDAELTWKLLEAFGSKISKNLDGLEKVINLEDDLIYCTCEMERQGTRLDVEKLLTWQTSARTRYVGAILKLYQLVGMRVMPSRPSDLEKLYYALKLPLPPPDHNRKTEGPSFTGETLALHEHLEPIKLVLEARRLFNLLSKYLDKYAAAVGSDGILRYQLNQLKSDQYGTITGRYSSSNINIQQVFAEERQLEKEFIIRQLFIPEHGKLWVKADASQIEFRLFAHYSQDDQLINAYRDDPTVDFHQVVAKMMGVSRTVAKSINFGKLYGMGPEKLQREMSTKLARGEVITAEEAQALYNTYERAFPAARRLMNEAMNVAKHRGYVRTLLGRRRYYNSKQRLHSALNAVIQGTAADIMKLKLLHLYNKRKELGLTLRFTVHDEVDGDLDINADWEALQAVMNESNLDVRVPILWDLKVGNNWADVR